MNGINLIPAGHRAQRQREARVRMWVAIAPVCASLLAGIYGYLAVSWDTNADDLLAQQNGLAGEIESAKSEIKRGKAAAKEVDAKLWASRAVAEQPDWGLLLALLGEKLDEDTVLSVCDLRPVAPSNAAGGGAASKNRVRPERYTLLISGFSKTQEGVSRFVMGLEKLGLFDGVTMQESRRTTMYAADAVEFRVECTVTDSGGDAR